MHSLSVIIPAHNEQDRIEKTIIQFIEWYRKKLDWFEIIIVNNGSTDQSHTVIDRISSAFAEVKYLDIPTAGKGLAIKHGISHALGEFVLIADADCSTDPLEVLKLLKKAATGSDIVIGSRNLPQSITERALLRKLIAAPMNLFANVYLSTRVSDHFCGFKLFTNEAASAIFKLQRIKGYSYDPEILYIARIHNFEISEIPIVWQEKPNSRIKFMDIFRILFDILIIRKIHNKV